MVTLAPELPEETVDAILGGRLRIIQEKQGYRFSIDALLLAHFAHLEAGDRLLDLGTGNGIVALLLAARHLLGSVVGIELQENLVTMARRNVILNGLEGLVEIRQGDCRQPAGFCVPASFDAVVFNPPYRRLQSGRMNPHPGKALARHEIAGTVGVFLSAAVFALREGGRTTAIYPAMRMVELLAQMRSARIEPKRMRIVHSSPGGRGEFVLVEGAKGGREGLQLLPPLTIYDQGRRYSGEMETIFRDLSAFPAAAGG